jgi:hypothetical protein
VCARGCLDNSLKGPPRPLPTLCSLSLYHLPPTNFHHPSFVFYTSHKMIPFDFIAEKNAQEAQHAFICKFVKAKHEIVSFVDNRLRWNKAREFLDYFKGSFNLSIAVRNSRLTSVSLFASRFWGRYTSRGERKRSRTRL